ncbi:MAG: type VI secretion system baseplate subunit TssF [Acidobacteria bacterium]|nr:type VI secretion system baseplate subunit TssF [Acidobacteriota bacterium]
MRDDLLLYYERELTYLRQTGALFAEKYPKIASRLQLEQDKCEDPHVERLLEAFAFLAARVHLKIDDEFPEITESLLSIVYPHFIRPIPSMSIVQFNLDPEKGKMTTGLKIDRNSVLYSRPVDGVPCKFRTCFDTTLYPITVVNAEWKTPDRLTPAIRSGDAVAVIRLELRTPSDVEFAKAEIDGLRFYLTGESAVVNTLYELLSINLSSVMIRDLTPKTRVQPLILPASIVKPVGFEADQGMMPYDKRSFIGYRLMQEYFTFPEKFFFIDVTGLGDLASRDFKNNIELIFLFSKFEGEQRRQRLESGVSAKTFRPNCTPVVNLFQQTAEPILLNEQKFEYRVIPDVRRPLATEVFSVDDVLSLRSNEKDVVRYEPFYSFRHSIQPKKHETLWISTRRPSSRIHDDGTEIDIALVDLNLHPVQPDADTVTVRTTCTNRDLPARLPFGNESGDFELESGAPVRSIVALVKPTVPTRPPIGKAIQWRLISHLTLNYLSLVEGGKEALQEILKLYNFTDSAFASKVIAGVTDVKSAPHFARVVSENGIAFARGTKVELELDEDQFVGGGAYLFAAVLERFLGLYTSLNSFSQLTATTRQRKEVLHQWAPRAGRKVLM